MIIVFKSPKKDHILQDEEKINREYWLQLKSWRAQCQDIEINFDPREISSKDIGTLWEESQGFVNHGISLQYRKTPTSY